MKESANRTREVFRHLPGAIGLSVIILEIVVVIIYCAIDLGMFWSSRCAVGWQKNHTDFPLLNGCFVDFLNILPLQ